MLAGSASPHGSIAACETSPLRVSTCSMAPDVASMTSTPTTPALKNSQKPPTGPNVLEVVLGSLLIKPWYPSFYPEELVGRRVERLYVCQWCFKYSKELVGFLGHLVRLKDLRGLERPVELIRLRKHVPFATLHPRALTSTQKTTIPSMKSMARRISFMRRTYRSLRSSSSTPNRSSTTSQPSCTIS